MKTFTPATSRIQTITGLLGRGRFEDALCPLATMLGARLALLLLFLSAALVQPCAGTPFEWTFTGSLNIPRAYHTATNTNTATMLSNGRVLVAGGAGPRPETFPYPGLASAELYDPATETWSFTGSTTTPRFGYHTATLLPNGMVLVAGGYDGTNHICANAELYDPATGTWTATGSLATARQDHTATLLANGKVLVVGGANDTAILASAELYDPATGTWTPTGSLNVARWEHTATRLCDGTCDGEVLVAGGVSRESSVATAELYNPALGNWTVTGSLNNARALHTATLLSGGFVLVAGGNSAGGGFLASAELYNAGPTKGFRYRPDTGGRIIDFRAR